MKDYNVKDLTLASVFTAIILVMTFVPQLGYIRLGGISLTLIHIPVLVGAFLLPKKYVLLLGLFFGVGSMVQTIITQPPTMEIAFINPLVSVLPRLLFALFAVYIIDLFNWIEKTYKHSEIAIFGIVTLITSLGIYYAGQAIIAFTGWNHTFITVLFLIVNVLFVTGYFTFIKNDDRKKIIVPSTLILSTFIHTLVVLTALVVFELSLVLEYIPSEQIFSVIMTVAVTNGLVEAILAAFIGTPILFALYQVREKGSL